MNIMVKQLDYPQFKIVKNQFLCQRLINLMKWKDLMDNCGILNKIFLKIVILFHLQQRIYLHFNHVVVNIYNSIQLIIPLDYMQNQGILSLRSWIRLLVVFSLKIYIHQITYFLKMNILQIQYNSILIIKIGIANLQKVLSLIKVEILETFLGQ
ncbi:unnamed protein product [Paramecium pentaurelia]|uniref:Uncharacterized protein n=1 Tax=Paramecium pentaurelia TaxID=43138 RepID=A0A8S1USV1_9CILI|nr:unnamed protein product [Paramecium pentaurelia]